MSNIAKWFYIWAHEHEIGIVRFMWIMVIPCAFSKTVAFIMIAFSMSLWAFFRYGRRNKWPWHKDD